MSESRVTPIVMLDDVWKFYHRGSYNQNKMKDLSSVG